MMNRLLAIGLAIAINSTSAIAQSAKAPQIPLDYYDVSELALLETNPYVIGGSAVFRDPSGIQHRVKVGDTVANYDIHLGSVQSDGVTLDKMVHDPDGDWIMLPFYDWKTHGSPIQRPVPPWANDENPGMLGPSEWPVTLKGAVRMIISKLTPDARLALKNTKKDDFAQYHYGFEMYIRNYYGLRRGNKKLLLSACGKPCDADNASYYILKAVWVELQK